MAMVWNSPREYESSTCTLRNMESETKQGEECVKDGKDRQEDIKNLIEDFANVFKKPEGLPPKREIDHKIPIKAPNKCKAL